MDLLELLVALINKHDSDWEATFMKEVLEMMGMQYYDEEDIPYFSSLEQ